MSDPITGTITKVRKDRKGFFIDGEWYSVFDSSEMDGVNKGDTVKFTFKKKGDWNNIDNGTVKKTEAAPASSGGGKSYGGGGGNSQFRSVPELNRIDGLRFATKIVGALHKNADLKEAVKSTLSIAAVFTAFIEGSIGTPAGAAPAPETNDADAAAKAAAEAAAQAEREAAAKAAEEAAKAQQAAGQSALDDFLGA